MKIIEDKEYLGMYRLEWSNKDQSKDMYNYPRASYYITLDEIKNLKRGEECLL